MKHLPLNPLLIFVVAVLLGACGSAASPAPKVSSMLAGGTVAVGDYPYTVVIGTAQWYDVGVQRRDFSGYDNVKSYKGLDNRVLAAISHHRQLWIRCNCSTADFVVKDFLSYDEAIKFLQAEAIKLHNGGQKYKAVDLYDIDEGGQATDLTPDSN